MEWKASQGGMLPMQNLQPQSRNMMKPINPIQAYGRIVEVSDAVQQDAVQCDAAYKRLTAVISELAMAANQLREAYDVVQQEKRMYSEQLEAAKNRLDDCERVVSRYTAVQEPVVASDGYTYERSTIQTYLEDCMDNKSTPQSQQTQQTLTQTLVPNRTLKKLLDALNEKASNSSSRMQGNGVQANGAGGFQGGANAGNYNNNNNNGAGGWNRRGGQGGGARGRGASGSSGSGGAANAGRNPSGEMCHPCIRVYGFCNYKDSCAYAQYPYDACLSHLKGKCRFGSQCHEVHVEYNGPGGYKGTN